MKVNRYIEEPEAIEMLDSEDEGKRLALRMIQWSKGHTDRLLESIANTYERGLVRDIELCKEVNGKYQDVRGVIGDPTGYLKAFTSQLRKEWSLFNAFDFSLIPPKYQEGLLGKNKTGYLLGHMSITASENPVATVNSVLCQYYGSSRTKIAMDMIKAAEDLQCHAVVNKLDKEYVPILE